MPENIYIGNVLNHPKVVQHVRGICQNSVLTRCIRAYIPKDLISDKYVCFFIVQPWDPKELATLESALNNSVNYLIDSVVLCLKPNAKRQSSLKQFAEELAPGCALTCVITFCTDFTKYNISERKFYFRNGNELESPEPLKLKAEIRKTLLGIDGNKFFI